MFVSSVSGGQNRSVFGNFWFEPVNRPGHVTPDSAMGLPVVWRCINVLASSFAMMPFHLYRPEGLVRKIVERHWLKRLISKAPNRFQSPFEWKQMMIGHLCLRGNAFNQILANGRGDIVELLPLHPDRMKMELLPDGEYRYLYRAEDGSQIVYPRGEIWHLRGLSSDGLVGLSPIEAHRGALGEGMAMQSYASRFYYQDARPAGWVEFDGRFANEEAKTKWRESWQKTYSSDGGPRKVAVLEKGMKYHELALSHADAQFVEARGANIVDIARIFGVPPHMAGEPAAANSNVEHQSIEFWTGIMLQLAECVESSIEFNLLGPDVDLEPEFDMSRLMRADGKSRAERLRGLVSGGILTPNEGRYEERYDPVEGGDVLFRPLNMAVVHKDGTVEGYQGADKPSAPVTVPGDPVPGARMERLLRSNASRMAKRAIGGNLTADVLADALAISVEDAANLLTEAGSMTSESEVCELMLSYALGTV